WHVSEQLCEGGPDAVLAALDAGRGDEDGIVGVVSDDLIQVACAERLGVVLEDFLRRACHFISFAGERLMPTVGPPVGWTDGAVSSRLGMTAARGRLTPPASRGDRCGR